MEEWRDIPGYEHLYQASNFGRIRTCNGKATIRSDGKRRIWRQRILKPKYCRRIRCASQLRDARVSLWKDGQEHTLLVSRLVAMTWCTGYSDEMTVNHIDGNPENNNADNLEWVTRSVNIQKGFETGLYSTQKATRVIEPNGCERIFRSMSEASRFMHKQPGYVSMMLKHGRTKSQDGYKFALIDN